MLKYWKKYRETHKEQIKSYLLEYGRSHRENLYGYHRRWKKTRRGQITSIINSQEYARGLGFNPINEYFEGSHYHHMYLNGSNKIGIFIPKKLHRSIIHDGRTKQGMKEINKAALLWLCEQSIIQAEN